MPDFLLELAAGGLVCGIDEAGRGPLAGPVVAAAALIQIETLPASLRSGLNDSKKLSASRREVLFARINDCPAILTGIGMASVGEIDQMNILRATHLAMQRAALALISSNGQQRPDLALIDGNQLPASFPCPTQAVVKGDSRSLSIAAASICAKVTRDHLMLELAGECPGYGWERNMGYGTAEHRQAIRVLGPTRHHRRSFAGQGKLFPQE